MLHLTFLSLRRGPFLSLCRHTRSHEDLAKQQAAAADPEPTPNMDEGRAQLLGLSCAPGSGLHGGRVPGEGDPFGALGGLLADMLPAGEEVLRHIGTSAGGAAWFPPPSKTLPHPDPTLTSPGASPQAGARRSPWDSFSSLASANGTAHGTAKGAVNGTGSGTASGIIGQLPPVPLGKAVGGNGTSAGGEASPCTPPTLQQAALWASKTLGGNPAQGITAKSRADLLWGNGNGSAVQAANGGACQDHDQASVLCGGPRRGRRGHSACAGLACGCMAGSGFELAPAHGLSTSSSCSSFVTAGSVSDDDDDFGFVEMLDAAASPTPNPNPPATLTEHLSVAIAELAAGRAVEGPIGFENPNTSPGGSPSADEPAPFQENLRRAGLSLGPGPGLASPVAEPGGPQAAPGEVPPLGIERAHEARSSAVRDVDARGHTGTAPQRQRQRGCTVGLGGQDRRSGRLVRTHSVRERPTKSCHFCSSYSAMLSKPWRVLEW